MAFVIWGVEHDSSFVLYHIFVTVDVNHKALNKEGKGCFDA